MAVEHSRALRLGAGASGLGESDLERALNAARVVVSVDPNLPGGLLTARVLLTTLRRLPGQIVLEREGLPNAVVETMAEAVHAVDPERPLVVGRSSAGTVRLHVGTGRGDEAIRIAPDGHGAHVAGLCTASIRIARAATPLGSIYSAALGAAEAFKYTARVLPGRRTLHRHLRFCPVALSADLNAAPMLAGPLDIALTLVGVGAIGTGVVLNLAELGAVGRLLAVDYQSFEEENRGTYSLGGPAEVAAGVAKVDLARVALPGIDVESFGGRVEDLPGAIDGREKPWHPTVISGLDTEEARRATQRLWPDRLIDAATGDTMLGLHDHVHNAGPCMLCFFPAEPHRPSAAALLSARTGLPVELLSRGDEILRDEHLALLSSEQRGQLKAQVGKPVCGLAQAIGLTGLDAGSYLPSVPFISLQSACLAVGRLIADACGVVSLPNFVQYDGLFGPQASTLDRMIVTAGCYCQTNAHVVERVRKLRRG
jgi:hypothetical protein